MKLINNMRIFLSVLILIFSLQSWTKADDIRDFQIEGMVIGDSALNFFSESKILSTNQNFYKGKEFSTSEIGNFQITYKSNDPKFILASIGKMEAMDISRCSKEILSIVSSIEDMFSSNVKLIGPKRLTHWADDSKKSWHDQYFFLFKNKDAIIVECYNWSENVPWKDHLRVRITTNEFLNFLQKE